MHLFPIGTLLLRVAPAVRASYRVFLKVPPTLIAKYLLTSFTKNDEWTCYKSPSCLLLRQHMKDGRKAEQRREDGTLLLLCVAAAYSTSDADKRKERLVASPNDGLIMDSLGHFDKVGALFKSS